MSLGLRTTPRLAVVSLVLVATATGAGTAHAADPITRITELVVTVPAAPAPPAPTGQLTVQLQGNPSPSASRGNGGVVNVTSSLPTVTITDSRSDLPGWSYSGELDDTLAAVGDSTVTTTPSNVRFRVPGLPVVPALAATLTGLHQRTEFVDQGQGPVMWSDAGSLANDAAFTPEVTFTLPAATQAREYQVVVTHSIV